MWKFTYGDGEAIGVAIGLEGDEVVLIGSLDYNRKKIFWFKEGKMIRELTIHDFHNHKPKTSEYTSGTGPLVFIASFYEVKIHKPAKYNYRKLVEEEEKQSPLIPI